MKSFFIIIILAVLSMTGISAEHNSDIIDEDVRVIEEEADLKTEVATVVEISNNVCVVITKSDEIYQIHGFSDFNISVDVGEKLVFSYTDKTKTPDGKYDIIVKWIDKWVKFSPQNIVSGL